MTSVGQSAGPRQVAAAVLPVNGLGGGSGTVLGDIGGAVVGSAAGTSSGAAGERPR